MKQQSDNLGFGSVLANRGCSKCYITTKQSRDPSNSCNCSAKAVVHAKIRGISARCEGLLFYFCPFFPPEFKSLENFPEEWSQSGNHGVNESYMGTQDSYTSGYCSVWWEATSQIVQYDLNSESGPSYVIIIDDGPISDRTSSKTALPFAHCAPMKLSMGH